jgi:hypothetical protein
MPAAAVFALAGAASAQVPGLPLFHEPFRAPAGVDHGVVLVLGQGRTDDGHDGSPSWTLGGRYRFVDRVIAQAAAGMHYPYGASGRDARLHAGGAFDVLLIRRTVTVGTVTGVGYAAVDDGASVLTVPLGLGGTWFIPVTGTGAGPKVGVWLMPRAEVLRRALDDAAETDLTWAASWGVSAATGAAIGFNLGVEYRSVPDAPTALGALPHVPDWSFALMMRLWR